MYDDINEIEKDLSGNDDLLEFMKLCSELPAEQLLAILSIMEKDNYEIINEELDIMACKLVDLSENRVNAILKCWDDGAPIETMTMFSLGTTVILNMEHPYYNTNLKLTEAYLAATAERRTNLNQKLKSSSLKEIMSVLDDVILLRDKELFNRTHNDEGYTSEVMVCLES